jgi:hypothetical protein
MYLCKPADAHTMFKILQVICTCKAYMFYQVFVIFMETGHKGIYAYIRLKCRKLHNHLHTLLTVMY